MPQEAWPPAPREESWEFAWPPAPPRTRQERGQPPTPEEVGRAAALYFAETETAAQIAQRLGIGRRTLARWKQRPEFEAALAALQV